VHSLSLLQIDSIRINREFESIGKQSQLNRLEGAIIEYQRMFDQLVTEAVNLEHKRKNIEQKLELIKAKDHMLYADLVVTRKEFNDKEINKSDLEKYFKIKTVEYEGLQDDLASIKSSIFQLEKIHDRIDHSSASLSNKMKEEFSQMAPLVREITIRVGEVNDAIVKESLITLLVFLLIEIGLVFIISFRFSFRMVMVVKKISSSLGKLAKGEIPTNLERQTKDELGNAIDAINQAIMNIEKSADFAQQIGDGDFKRVFNSAGENDQLGNALITMRDKLSVVAEEDKKRNWSVRGMAEFADILRKYNTDTTQLSKAIIREMVNYMSVNQGALYVLDEDADGNAVLEQKGLFAWSKEKMAQKVLNPVQGLVGQCFIEKEPILLTEVPSDYIEITSGLGKAIPTFINLIPLMMAEECFGVIELAGFRVFEEYEVEFLKEVAESIASTISSVKVTEKTKLLLDESKEMTEQMKAQEEEMRQNAEELQATMEENEMQNQRLMKEIEELRAQQS